MNKAIEKWIKIQGMEFLTDIGVKPGQTVLDFGCGTGHYSISAAKLVGNRGRVYALDKDSKKLSELVTTAQNHGLTNILPLHEYSTDHKIELGDTSIDAVLLYDILHFFGDSERKGLYYEISRLRKSNSLFSLFPKHSREDNDPYGSLATLTIGEITDEIETANFSLVQKTFRKVLHNDTVEMGYILNFQNRGVFS